MINKRRSLLLLAASAVVLGLGMLTNTKPKAPETTSVVVSTRPLAINQVLQASDLSVRAVQSDLLPGGVVAGKDLEDILQRRSQRVLAPGEVITWSSLEGASDIDQEQGIPEGMALVALAPENLAELQDYLKPHDSVDLLWIPNQQPDRTYTLIRDAIIRRVQTTSIGFLLNTRDATRLEHAKRLGKIRMIIKHRQPAGIAAEPPTSISTEELLQTLDKKPAPVKVERPSIEIVYGRSKKAIVLE